MRRLFECSAREFRQLFGAASGAFGVIVLYCLLPFVHAADPVDQSLLFGNGSPNEWGSEEVLPVGVMPPYEFVNGYRTSVSGSSSDASNPLLPEIVTGTRFSGDKSFKFVVPGNDAGGDADSRRSEVELAGYNRRESNWSGTVHWLGWAFRLDPDWPLNESRDSRTVIAQTHRTTNEPGLSPTWGIRVRGDGSMVLTQEFEGYPNSSSDIDFHVADSRGDWIRAVMQVKYHGHDEGFIRLWFDDVLVLELQSIRTWQPNAELFGFYKFGIYASWHRHHSAHDKVMWIDDIRIADASKGGNYATVDPATYHSLRPAPPQALTIN